MCFRHTYLFECKLKVHIRNPSVTPTQQTWIWMLRTVNFLMADLSELVLVLWVQRWGYLETGSCSWYLSLFELCSVERWAYRWRMWSQFLLSLASTDIDHFKTGVSSRTKTAPRLKNAAHAPPSLGRNVPSFMLILSRGRDIQHVQHVNTFNERRRSQGKGKSSV